jgi:hypothetical protein
MVWAVSLSTTKLSPRRLTHVLLVVAFAVCLGLVTSTWPRAQTALYLHDHALARGCTSMHFGENQLSPRSVGISPLSTAPPPVLQHGWVRASTDCHIRFTLAMDSSRGFGSHPPHEPPSRGARARFRLGFPLAPSLLGELTARGRCTRRIILQKARHQSLLPCGRVTSDCW